ncbi:hypothetical protein LOY97_006347 [Ophidiomyces ophidiicola]|nr:hypothetical protein LOZ49_006609 [Ophidiomyces ophidiicola]KAI2127089.1 hypothetical protein LOZ29_006792 [Ophidiomyces ophidiicola]KAI2134270.1 hypothetical protein LOZ28_005053 [Ophidiomyces ophidiicola]KAI2214131.1 hypothetical protein LOZ15_004881 [Ophidiomyces ophidiicola]KAI2343287.1 hypothetical protein LOY92_006370 [Ophidiomyces ophidiicola]
MDILGDVAPDPRRRSRETAQLHSRLGRDRSFFAHPDGISFTVPIRPVRPDLLPHSLKQLLAVDIVVPDFYPAVPCRLNIWGVEDESARFVEISFDRHVQDNPEMSLTAHINYLSAMIHTMIFPPPDEGVLTPPAAPIQEEAAFDIPIDPEQPQNIEDRPHIQTIPRPPEWAAAEDDYSGDESDYSEDSASDADNSDSEDVGKGAEATEVRNTRTSREVLLSFPSLGMRGIELLEIKRLSLTLKCDRCKDVFDPQSLKVGEDGVSIPPERTEICKKCSSYMNIGFRREFMHSNSTRGGVLRLEGCTAVDLLPSHFYPTCSECSFTYPSPGIIAVRGDIRTVVCRGCHNHMDFKIPELKFLMVAAADESTPHPLRAIKKHKESLGLVAGKELPRRGRCLHYRKSYRWFRFSCCLKVFPCDKCHDAVSDHPNEHANRMICGFCSREQIYYPETCSTCHSNLVGKRGGGFWEGGKGTRDKKLMSRKGKDSNKQSLVSLGWKVKAAH